MATCGVPVKTDAGWVACGKPAPHIVAYSATDTDQDRFYCDEHVPPGERLDEMSDEPKIPVPEGVGLIVLSDPSTGMVDVSLSAEGAQDMRDGIALRRLREALPADTMLVCEWLPMPAPDSDTPIWSIRVESVFGNGHQVTGSFGDTIAEAADACREALSK